MTLYLFILLFPEFYIGLPIVLKLNARVLYKSKDLGSFNQIKLPNRKEYLVNNKSLKSYIHNPNRSVVIVVHHSMHCPEYPFH